MTTKKEQRLRRARQTRIRIADKGVCRLSVNRTNLHIYATVFSAAGVDKVAFDRAGFAYHGRVKALAEAAREAGLQF